MQNPYGPSPRVREALADVPLGRYPDSGPFLEALSNYTGYPLESIVAGAGMDEIITTIVRLFLGPGDRALIPVPTYNLYCLAARLCGAMPVYHQGCRAFRLNRKSQRRSRWYFSARPTTPPATRSLKEL